MNRSIYHISLELRGSHGACQPEMYQADTHRQLQFTLTDGGKPYCLTDGCYPVFTAKKPDDTVIFNPCRIENNTVIYDITPQTTAQAGLLRCQLRLYDGPPEEQAQLLSCAAFGILVHPTVYNEEDLLASGNEVSALTALIGEATAARQLARDTAQALLQARDAGEFDGPAGPAGADGYTPVRGTDYWTEADLDYMAGQVETAILGDIEAALDTIVAIQEELVGKLEFFIYAEFFTALKGMTWAQWCDSRYNTIGAYIDAEMNIVALEWFGGAYLADENGETVYPDDLIIEGYMYTDG